MNAPLSLIADAGPLLAFLAHFSDRVLKALDGGIALGDLGLELVSLESDYSPAPAGELTVRIYPSDRLLGLAATVAARNIDPCAIEKPSHAMPPNC
jgi:hypothetical protein